VTLIRVIDTASYPTPRLLQACAAFGLAVRHAPAPRTPPITARARGLVAQLRPGQVALITGPSGSGKSSLLRACAAAAERAGEHRHWVDASPATHQPLIDTLDAPLPKALRALAHAGLADATLLARTPAELSEGERFRFGLALALSAAPAGPTTLLIDEFASVLDRTTARCLCHALRRWLRHAPHARIIAATAHDDIAPWLEPDIHVTTP
jgi:ABC-type ATPase with predicted acetyltransferase domain